MKLGIIIPVSRLDETRDCLDSLNAQDCNAETFEVVLVSALHDLSDLNSPTLKFTLTTVQSSENHPSKLRNLAVAEIESDALAFLDDDTIVAPHFVSTVLNQLSANPDAIIGGPNVDRRDAFEFALANAVQEHPLLEGLKNHRSLDGDKCRVGRHDLPLSNASMLRATFERIGGFNEVANYYMDGSEFLYIAEQLNIPIYLFQALEIQHNNRPAFMPYLRYKFRARHMIGMNIVSFPECYLKAKPIWLIFSSFIIGPLLIAYLLSIGALLEGSLIGAAGYLILLYLFGLKSFTRPSIGILVAPMVLFAQIAMYCGFVSGLIRGILTVRSTRDVRKFKTKRYAVIAEGR